MALEPRKSEKAYGTEQQQNREKDQNSTKSNFCSQTSTQGQKSQK